MWAAGVLLYVMLVGMFPFETQVRIWHLLGTGEDRGPGTLLQARQEGKEERIR